MGSTWKMAILLARCTNPINAVVAPRAQLGSGLLVDAGNKPHRTTLPAVLERLQAWAPQRAINTPERTVGIRAWETADVGLYVCWSS